MEMYDIIADNYARIFPLDKERVDFVKSLLRQDASILDIGCATGELCVELAQCEYNVVGIDLNVKMIEIAQRRKQKNAEFLAMNMLDIDKAFNRTSFSLICCFGNTLPHLDSLSEIAEFFRKIYSRLELNGSFVFQILNYDKILRERKFDFSEISKKDFVFTRHYKFLEEKIQFTINMEIDNIKMQDSTLLFPIRKESAISMLTETGFKKILCFKDYSLAKSDGKEKFTLYVAEK